MTLDIAFDLALEHGRCVGIQLPSDAAGIEEIAATLLPVERTHGLTFGEARRRTWIGGRVAMRQALLRAGIDAPALMADGRGAPRLPSGIAGSISHKTGWAVALVAREQRARIGVDIEDDVVGSLDISHRILTPQESLELASLDADARAREVLLRFSAKEALYKALDPFVQRYVAFGEVAVWPSSDGTARTELHLTEKESAFSADVRWLRIQGLVLTTARVTPA